MNISGILFRVSNSEIGICRTLHSDPIYFTAYYLSDGTIKGLDSKEFNIVGNRASAIELMVADLISNLTELYTNEFSYKVGLNYDNGIHQADEYKIIG